MRQVQLFVDVVVPDDIADGVVLSRLSGRELPGVAGTWVAAVALAHSPRVPERGVERGPVLFVDVLDAEADADAGLTP